jgi:hypothetical protein
MFATINHHFYFHWIPAHAKPTPYIGNEIADRLAKLAATSNLQIVPFHSNTSISSTKHLIKMKLQDQLATNWKINLEHKPFLQILFPTILSLQSYLNISHKFLHINNLISHHLPTHSLLNRLKIKTGAACPVCMVEDSVAHLLFACIKYQRQRHILMDGLTKILRRSPSQLSHLKTIFQKSDATALTLVDQFLDTTIYCQFKKRKPKEQIDIPKLKKKRISNTLPS